MEYYQPHIIVKFMAYFLFVWFFIALLSKKQTKTDLPLLVLYMVNAIWIKDIASPFDSVSYINEFISNKEFLIGIATAFGLLILALNKNNLNKYSRRQFGLLGFVVLCHSMILWDLTMSQSWLTGMFYTYYDELIIIIGLLQVWVSRGGILSVISGVQSFNYRVWFRGIYSNKVYFTRTKRKG